MAQLICDNHGPFDDGGTCPGCTGKPAPPTVLTLDMGITRVVQALESQALTQRVLVQRVLMRLGAEEVDVLGELLPAEQERLRAAWAEPALRANLVELLRAVVQPPAQPQAPRPEGQVPLAVPERKVDMVKPAKPPQAAEPQGEAPRVLEMVADEPPPPEDPAVAEAERKLADAQRELEQAKHPHPGGAAG